MLSVYFLRIQNTENKFFYEFSFIVRPLKNVSPLFFWNSIIPRHASEISIDRFLPQ